MIGDVQQRGGAGDAMAMRNVVKARRKRMAAARGCREMMRGGRGALGRGVRETLDA